MAAGPPASLRAWRLRPPGLRARLVGALLLTSAVTLAVAALALLPPLERRLRREEVDSLESTAVAFRPTFQDVELRGPGLPAVVGSLARSLERRAGARVVVFDESLRPVVDTQPQVEPSPPGSTDRARDRFGDAALALARRRPVKRLAGGSPGFAEVAVSVHLAGHRYVVALRKRLGDVARSVDTVKRAFVTAALAGLAVAVLVGFGLATTLLRRLRRLREAALRLGEHGLSAEAPRVRGRDEVGDLARAFASMQTQLRAQEDARRRFVATASHELRTPLASLAGVLELADEDLHVEPPEVDDAREQLRRARDQSRRLAALAADLLDLSRLDAEMDLRSEPIELSELCRAAAAEFELRVQERRTALRLSGPEGSVWAQADPGSVARIVRILVDNALRFTPAGAPVELTLSQDDGMVELSVADQGPGVPEPERDLIFERFRRGSAPGDGAGFGLGLAIGRELAERMGGSLGATGENGRGARFVLRLPSAGLQA